MALPPIEITNIVCHLPSRPKLTWRAKNIAESGDMSYPTAGYIEVDDSWLEIPMAGPGECPVPLPPGTACADQGGNFQAHLAAVQTYGIDKIRLHYAGYDPLVIVMPITCGG